MDQAQGVESIKELTAWLEADDAKNRTGQARASRNTLPRPGHGTVRPAATAQRRLTFLTMSNFGVKNARGLHPSYIRA